jgi:hypothetical protein
VLLFGDLRFVPNDPTTIGACFAAQTEELITAILDRSISLLLCLLLRALFFCIKTAKTVLQKPFFSSVLFKRNFFEKWIVLCVRDQKRKIFVCKFVHVVSLPLAAATHPKSAEIGACLWHKISVLSSSA